MRSFASVSDRVPKISRADLLPIIEDRLGLCFWVGELFIVLSSLVSSRLWNESIELLESESE